MRDAYLKAMCKRALSCELKFLRDKEARIEVFISVTFMRYVKEPVYVRILTRSNWFPFAIVNILHACTSEITQHKELI